MFILLRDSKMEIKDDFESMTLASTIFYVQFPPEVIKNDWFYCAATTIFENWHIARNWMINKVWDSTHKIHPNKVYRDGLKPRGELLIQYYRLCERCHGFQEYGYEVPYKNAGVWFSKIFVELIGIEVETTAMNCPKVYNRNFKEALIAVEQKKSGLLRSRKNPFDGTYGRAEGLHQLIEISLKLCHESNVFKKEYWKPYLKAYSEHIREIQSSRWGIGYVENGTYYLPIEQSKGGGRGRGRVAIGEASYYKEQFFKS